MICGQVLTKSAINVILILMQWSLLEGFYGMVSPVFAEEVDETLENITPIAKFEMKPMRMSVLH